MAKFLSNNPGCWKLPQDFAVSLCAWLSWERLFYYIFSQADNQLKKEKIFGWKTTFNFLECLGLLSNFLTTNLMYVHCKGRILSKTLVACVGFSDPWNVMLYNIASPSRKKIFHWVENVIKQLVHTSGCVHWDMKYLGSLESTREARVALGYASYASFVLSKLPACFIPWWTHADVWTNC